jgi:hypothetical protein
MRDQAKQRQGQNGANGQPSQSQSRSQQGGQQSSGQQSNGQQSQSGQEGQQNAQGGQNGGQRGDNADGGAYAGGAYRGDGRYWGGYYGGRWDPNDIRQYRRDFREWANDAEALRRQLQQAGVNPRDLDDIIRDLTRFDNDRLYADPNGLAQLQAQVMDKMKKFEFSLRRKADGAGNESLGLSGADQVPEGFRQAIEEYYRSLAKKAGPQPPQK